MKSPAILAAKLARQWENADTREERLTSPEIWPLRIPIGRPSPRELNENLDAVRAHIHAWDAMKIGAVEWEAIAYRSASEPIKIPLCWRLERPSDWIEACENGAIGDEYTILQQLCAGTPPLYHRLWIRKRHLWREKDPAEVILAAELAEQLEPDCAEGRPLRALSLAGIDSKFYERNQTLLVQLLDLRHAGRVSEVGLEVFLGAAREGEHWLLLADLDGNLLPFTQQRVRASELREKSRLPGTHLILVENERSLHQLPRIRGCLAILGSGLNLNWLAAPNLSSRRIAYWGDLDTWGLQMLATARQHLPQLIPLMMDHATYDRFARDFAVHEAHRAPKFRPENLLSGELALLQKIAASEKGRVEQEFLPREYVHEAIAAWYGSTP